MPHTELRRITTRYRRAWNLGPPYSFRLALLRGVVRQGTSYLPMSRHLLPTYVSAYQPLRIYLASSYYYICVLILLYMCPHPTTYVSSSYSFRLALLRSISREDLSLAAVRGGGGGGDGGEDGGGGVLREPYWEMGLVWPLIELAGTRVCRLGRGAAGQGVLLHTTIYVYTTICVLMPLCVCPHATMCVFILLYMRHRATVLFAGAAEALYVFNVMFRGVAHRHAGLLGHEFASALQASASSLRPLI